MEKIIDLAEYGRKIMVSKDKPHILDHINLELVGWYAYYSSMMIPLELREAHFWEENKNLKAEKPTSDAMVRALWKITTEGNMQIEIERTLKTIEKIMSSLRVSINRANQEYKTQK